MKQILTVLIGFTLIFSACNTKEKLPANILTAVERVNSHAKMFNDIIGNKLDSLSDRDIESLSKDSLRSLTISYEFFQDEYLKTKKELDELLKYNAKFSDYDEVKNRLTPKWVNGQKVWERYHKILNDELDAEIKKTEKLLKK